MYDYRFYNEENENLSLHVVFHSQRVAQYVNQIASHMNYNSKEKDQLILTALLHDVGKARIEPYILNKGGKLTYLEYEEIKKHTEYAVEILKRQKYVESICRSVKFHHENMDGSGYYGMEGNNIPLESRIVRIADVFDALTSERCYKATYSKEQALEIMKKEKHIYDKNIFEVFKRVTSNKKVT